MNDQTEFQRPQLQKGIGKAGMFSLAFGAMIGVGWVTAMGSWLSDAGPLGAVIAFAIGGLLMLAIGFCYAEVTAALPVSGGEVAYAYKAYGTSKAFIVGWFLVFGYLSVSAFEAISISKVISYLVPSIDQWQVYSINGSPIYFSHIALSAIFVLIISAINYTGVNPNQVMSILEDQYGDVWLGTNGAGVYRYDGKTFEQFLSNVGMVYEDGQQHNIILSMVEDLNHDIWFSSLSHGGVSRFDGKEFTHYVNELSDDFVRVVFCDSKGKIWIGTHGNHDGGLDLFDGKTFTAFHKTNDGFSHNNVSWIYEDKSGQLWMGSGTTNLSLFDGKHFKSFEGNDGQTYDKVQFVVGDQEDNIWFGNRSGLWLYDGTNVIEMTKS